MHRLQEADEAFSNVLAIDSPDADAYFGLWLVRSRAGRPEAGIGHLRAAV